MSHFPAKHRFQVNHEQLGFLFDLEAFVVKAPQAFTTKASKAESLSVEGIEGLYIFGLEAL